MNNKVYVGDVGTEIVLDCGCDVSDMLSATVRVQKPDGSESSWEAELKVGEETKIVHVTAAGDLDQAGKYRLQASPALQDWQGRGETVVLRVYDHYK